MTQRIGQNLLSKPQCEKSIGTSPRQKMHSLCQKTSRRTHREIEQRQSTDTIPSGDDVISKLATTPDLKNLDTAGKAAVVKIFDHLQLAHDELSKLSGSIVSLGNVTSPDQFAFVLFLAIRPLIQLKLPPQLCSPAE